ncbi:hypothetical protein AJ78_05288 [Emergomyces pasteurianus Ep9510]|uniref:Uncharacterized protein n=1 Tax=Emergomyces pasteurianus Ep9510 TaxID=1447872 RepID=A0A1J9PCV9_9EURO|nr:hypothetical protein AJ78_05288 [Emergomyces pasteurianus Ep9510]
MAFQPINPNPSPSAQTAAVQAFRASQTNATISTAAAAAALRRHTPTPTSVESIQTKRMLRRQLSAASVGTAAQLHTQNGRLHRSSSSGSMTTRTFRGQPPADPGSIAGSNERNISPVPPLPQSFLAHRRAASLDPSYRAINPPQNSSRSPGARSPTSRCPRSPRALSSLPELERQGSRSSINFSYPTHARPNSPPQSPVKISARKSPVSDEARDTDEELSQSLIVARTSTFNTPPTTTTTRGSKSYPDLGAIHGNYDESTSSGTEPTTHATAEIEISVSPEERDFTLSHHTHPANPNLSTHGEAAEVNHHLSGELHSPKTQPPLQYDDREGQAITDQHIMYPSEAHAPKTHQADEPTDPTDISKTQQLHGSTGYVETDKATLPTGSAIDLTLSTDTGSTPYMASETPSQSRAHDPVDSTPADPSNERHHSLSPARTTRFSDHLAVSLTGERLHDPPPRSMSPGKSALKHPTPQSSPGDGSAHHWSKSLQTHSEPSDSVSSESDDGQRAEGKKRAPKVSFEDEPEVVGTAAMSSISQGSPVSSSPPWVSGPKYSSFARNGLRFNTNNGNGEDAFDEVMKPRPALPSFGSVRGRRGLTDDHNKGRIHDGSPSTKMFGSGNTFSGILHQGKHTHSHDPMTSPTNAPLPPEVTSVEGTGYDSMSEQSSSSDDIADPHDFIPPGDSITSFAPSDIQRASGDSHDIVNESAGGGLGMSDNVPVISIHPATPAIAEERNSNEWTRIPGEFPSPMPHSEHETPQLSTESAQQPRSATTDSAPHPKSASIPSDDGDESDDSGESVYSDAAENLSDLDGDGFGSINAIVDSPVSHGSSYTHTPPPDSPTRSKADKKRSSDVLLQRNELRNSSPLGGVYTNAPLPIVEEEVLPLSASSSNRGKNMDGIGGGRHVKSQRLQRKFDRQERTSTTADSTRTAQVNENTVNSDQVVPNGRLTHSSTKSSRDVAPQPGPKSKRSKRSENDTTTSHNREYSSQKRNGASTAKRRTENGHISHSSTVPTLDFAFASRAPTQPTAYDSDSSSSFKRDRRSPRSTTGYSLKRTLRTPSGNRPHSSGGYSEGVGGRSSLPTSQQRPFSSDHNLSIRTTLRGPRSGLHAEPSSFASFRKPSKLKGVTSGLNAKAGRKSGSKLVHANTHNVGWPRPFQSRYEDSSDDEVAPMEFSPVRGIPKRKDGIDGDSTDLEDSSEDETVKKVLKRHEPRRRSIIPSNGKAKQAPAPVPKTDSRTITDAAIESTSVMPNQPGAFLPQLPKRRGSIFDRFGRSKHKVSDDSKIRKSELDSAARRDSPLERSRFELQRNRSLRSSLKGGDVPLSSSIEAHEPKNSNQVPITISPKEADVKDIADVVGSGPWPLRPHTNAPAAKTGAPIPPIPETGESDPERPRTSDGFMTNNGNATFHVSISGPTSPATESSNWTSRFRPRLHHRRGTSSTLGEDSIASTKSDAGTTGPGPDDKKKKKKFSLLKKAFGMSSKE